MAKIATQSSKEAVTIPNVSEGFDYRGVWITPTFKPTRRTARLDAAMRKILQMKLAER